MEQASLAGESFLQEGQENSREEEFMQVLIRGTMNFLPAPSPQLGLNCLITRDTYIVFNFHFEERSNWFDKF